MRDKRRLLAAWDNYEVIAAVAFALACNWLSIPLHDLFDRAHGGSPKDWLAPVLLLVACGWFFGMTIRDRFPERPKTARDLLLSAWKLKTPLGVVAGMAVTIVVAQLAFDALIDMWNECAFVPRACGFSLYRLIAVGLFLPLLVWWLNEYARFPRYIDRVAHAKQTELVRAHAALVWFLSDSPFVTSIGTLLERFKNDNPGESKRHGANARFKSCEPGLTLKDLGRDIAVLEVGAAKHHSWNGEQLLRALEHHAQAQNGGPLKSLYVAASKDSKGLIDFIAELIHRYDLLKHVKIYYVEGASEPVEIDRPADQLIAGASGLNFEKFEAALLTIETAVKHAGDDVIVDITGGQKPNTAAAMLFTVDRKIRIQYVQTKDPKGIVTYDIAISPTPSA